MRNINITGRGMARHAPPWAFLSTKDAATMVGRDFSCSAMTLPLCAMGVQNVVFHVPHNEKTTVMFA